MNDLEPCCCAWSYSWSVHLHPIRSKMVYATISEIEGRDELHAKGQQAVSTDRTETSIYHTDVSLEYPSYISLWSSEMPRLYMAYGMWRIDKVEGFKFHFCRSLTSLHSITLLSIMVLDKEWNVLVIREVVLVYCSLEMIVPQLNLFQPFITSLCCMLMTGGDQLLN